MALEQRDKELVAIGASIGSGCRPCIDHHIRAGQEAGLSPPELAGAVEVAEATQRTAIALLSGHVRALLHAGEISIEAPRQETAASQSDELVALGAAIASNCHPLLDSHLTGALELGLTHSQVRSAIKMAQIVQRNAAEITARKAADAQVAGGIA